MIAVSVKRSIALGKFRGFVIDNELTFSVYFVFLGATSFIQPCVQHTS